MPQPETHNHIFSWIQLSLFTLFLFLLVAIPYAVYLRSAKLKNSTQIVNTPSIVKPSPLPTITPPTASTVTTCISVPDNYAITNATPAAYFFEDKQKQLCYPPILPPFPFIWKPYTNYQYGYTIDTPQNWLNESTTIKGLSLHVFTSEETSTTSAVPSISFAWSKGQDPYASISSYFKQKIIRDNKIGTVYTKDADFITAVFPMENGYFFIQTSQMDSAFYALQHMLDSLKFK